MGEYAARGGSEQRKFLRGNDQPASQACWKANDTCEVGKYPAGQSKWGVLDMAGNVFEWTGSYWMDMYSNPREADGESTRVLRGGSEKELRTEGSCAPTAGPPSRKSKRPVRAWGFLLRPLKTEAFCLGCCTRESGELRPSPGFCTTGKLRLLMPGQDQGEGCRCLAAG